MASINLSPGAFPRYIGQYPLVVDRTRELTVGKCNIWRAAVDEATRLAIYAKRPHSSILSGVAYYCNEASL